METELNTFFYSTLNNWLGGCKLPPPQIGEKKFLQTRINLTFQHLTHFSYISLLDSDIVNGPNKQVSIINHSPV